MMQTAAVELTREETERRIVRMGQWFQNIELNGVRTAPNHFLGDYPGVKWQRFARAIPPDLTGKAVLEIGCNAGFDALDMKRGVAERVLGVNFDERYLAQARFTAEGIGADIEFRQLSVYDVSQHEEKFD